MTQIDGTSPVKRSGFTEFISEYSGVLGGLAHATWQNSVGRTLLLTIYYLFILMALVVLYGRGDFSTPKFVYQGF